MKKNKETFPLSLSRRCVFVYVHGGLLERERERRKNTLGEPSSNGWARTALYMGKNEGKKQEFYDLNMSKKKAESEWKMGRKWEIWERFSVVVCWFQIAYK